MARKYRRKRHYSTPERILLHLSARDQAVPPRLEDYTQDGIGTATLSGRSTVTKWLARLQSRGHVMRTKARVPSCPRPRIVYRLSESGTAESEKLLVRLHSELIEIRTRSVGTLTLRLPDASKLVPARQDLTRLASLVREGRLDVTHATPAPRRAEGFVVWWDALRQVDHLFGRSGELRVLDAWSRSRTQVLIVTGLPGIGKSALVAEWIRQHRSPAHVFGYQLHPSTKASALFAEFGAFMGSLGRRSLGEELSRERTLDRELVKRLLAMDLAGLPILIVLDGFEQASKEIAALVKETFAGLTDITPLRLLLTTRRTPAWASEMAGDGGLLQVLTLHGLAPEDSVALLQRRGVAADPSELREFAALTSGHPLLLHLVAQGGATSVSAVQEYFDALWKGLTAEERRVLETASVARRPIPRPALESAARARHGTVESLRTKNLLERTVAGRYMVHDLLRDFLHARVGAIHGRRIHEGLARPLMNAAEARDRWEGVYHLLQAGRVGEAAAYLDAEGAPLMDSVAAEEIASLARSHPADSTDAAMSCVFSELLGDSLRILGHVEPAIYQYTHASRLAEAAGRVERIPRLLRKMASLERWQNRYSKALGYLVEAHARLGTTGNPVERTEVLRELSLVEQALGDLSKAASHLNEAIDLATEGSDWPALSRALLALGSLEAWRGDREAGLAHSQEGLRVATRSGDLTEVAHANIVVGTALGELGRLEESLPFYEKGFELARRLGNLRLTAYALMNRTGALIDLGRCREAGGPLREAQGLIGILGERDTLGLLRIYEGNRERGMGRWTRAKQAWDEGLSALRRFGSPIDLGRALLEVGVFLRDHGEFGEGRAYLLEALGIAQNLGNETLRSEIEGALHGVGRPTIVTDET